MATTDVTFTVTVSDTVAGTGADLVLSFNEVSVEGGTIKNFATAGMVTTITVTPAAAGDVKLTVEAGAITNNNGMTSDAKSETVTVHVIDNDSPVLTVVPPGAPTAVDDPATTDRNEKGLLMFRILSNEKLYSTRTDLTAEIPALTINDIDIDTGDAYPLADGDLTKDTTAHGDSAESYTLYVRPRAANTAVRVEVRANAAQDLAGNRTPGAEGVYNPEGDAPTVTIAARNLVQYTDLCPEPVAPNKAGDVDSLDGAMITITPMDNVALASNAAIARNEVDVNRGSIKAGSFKWNASANPKTATFTLIPNIGETTVEVVVKANVVHDDAGNGNAEKKMPFNVGPIFHIPVNTIMVVTKTAGMTYDYLSDQPRLPVNQQPPTPAPNIETVVWCNMPDLEVLFRLKPSGTNQGFGGTLNLKEAPGQSNLANQVPYGGENQRETVRISEVMWASDLSMRGATNDEEAAEQWIELSNDTGKAVEIFLYARTGLDSAVTHNEGVKDRIGNAYNGSPGSAAWAVREEDDSTDNNSKGQNGNSYTGVNFISMHRSYVGDKNRGYVNGTSAGHWHESDREYLASTTRSDTDNALYHYIGSPGSST